MTECMIWKGYTNKGGYGVKTFQRKHKLLHRVAWEWANGPIPDGANVLHRCDKPACVNPEHLFLGTQADNMRDMYQKGRSRGQKQTHCKHGHPLFGENLYMNNGRRQCRSCDRRAGAKYRQKRAEACVRAMEGRGGYPKWG